MNILDDVVTYIRRLIKTPSNSSFSDNLVVDYINRFVLMNVDARLQLFDYKTVYAFQTIPGIIDYNIPLYTTQSSSLQSTIYPFPMYQGFLGNARINGYPTHFNTERNVFNGMFPLYTQQFTDVATGDGSTTTFSITLGQSPLIPGHVKTAGIVETQSATDPIFGTSLASISPQNVHPRFYLNYTNATGENVTICDSGQFLSNATDGKLYGLLMIQGVGGGSNTSLGTYSTTSNTICYNDGTVNVTFPTAPQASASIQAQAYFYNQGRPRGILFFDNTLTVLPSPDVQYYVEIEAYLTPAAFLTTSQSLPFAYMADYIARGATRMILSDTGDIEQFNFYEPLFREQELLVLKRSERIKTAQRTPTIYSASPYPYPYNYGQGSY